VRSSSQQRAAVRMAVRMVDTDSPGRQRYE
jgi:hypothetical protein